MEPGPSNCQNVEERRSAQRQAFMEQIREQRIVPRSENIEISTDASRGESSISNVRPSFGNLSACKIDRDTESALFDLETTRLLDGLEASNLLVEDDIAIQLPDEAPPEHWFSHLNSLLSTLMCSLAISALDDITVLRTYRFKSRAHNAIVACAGQRIRECQMDISALGYTKLIHSNPYWGLGNPRKLNLEYTNSVLDSQAAGYYAIIDYMTAVVARLLVPSLKEDSAHDLKTSWHAMTVTALAKASAKMKVLGHRLSDFKIRVDGESTPEHVPGRPPSPPSPPPPATVHPPRSLPYLSPIPRLPSSDPLSSVPPPPLYASGLPPPPPPPGALPPGGYPRLEAERVQVMSRSRLLKAESLSSEYLDTTNASEISEQSDTTSDSEGRPSGRSSDFPDTFVPKGRRSQKNNYLSDMSEISVMLFHIMWRVLSELEARSIGDQRTNELDISVLVYATGTQKTSAMLYQDAGSEVTGSQTGVALGLCRRMFDTLSETAHAIQSIPNVEEDDQIHLLPKPVRPQLRINMNSPSFQGSAPGIALDLRSMSELISIMIPLSCMNPSVADRVLRACSKVGASDTIRSLHAGGRGFTATASLCSVTEASTMIPTTSEAQSSPLSKTSLYLRQSGAESTSDTTSQLQAPRWLQNIPSGENTYRQLSQLNCRQDFDETRKWAIEGTAITVRCLNYTLPIMVGCGILVTGGLLAGFLVGERIAGVDPFNLTMFCLIIAGFIILVAKSIRVVSWPWRDFLLGRVTTRSVSELASVTGLDEQSIILQLLSREGSLPLIIRGPFNSVFNWGGEGDTGFSIDVQPTVRTLFASGMVVLEVLSSGGPALVCMDLRSEMNRFHPVCLRKVANSQNERVSVLACVEPPTEDEDDKNIIFRNQRIRWERVIGVYNGEDRKVG